MRKLIVAAFISLDGVIQAPGAPEEDPASDFRLGGWATPYDDEAIDQAQQDLFAQPLITRYVRGGEVRTATWGEGE
jgi:hypothetical protein